MPEDEWASLPLAIRRRFSKRLAGGETVVYAGEVLETWMSRAGWWLAQAARLIGGPLPLTRNVHVPSVVTVTEDTATGGQIWTRLYGRRDGFPQVIHSSKRFAGPTGLEEYVGRGVGMALTVYAREGALIFRSKDYFVQLVRPALHAAGLALPRRHVRHPRRAARPQVQLHAADHPSALRPAHPPDGDVPGGAP